MQIPRDIDGAVVVSWATVSDDVQPTGRTQHVAGGTEIGPASALAIGVYPDDPGFYLLYLDAEGTAMTDTYHDSLDGAVRQAEFEYRGLSWTAPAEP